MLSLENTGIRNLKELEFCRAWYLGLYGNPDLTGLEVLPSMKKLSCDLRNTTEISNLAHREQEPIFITKDGYSDLVVMSSELYDKFAKIHRIDQAIDESEQEILSGAEAVDADTVFVELERKHFG